MKTKEILIDEYLSAPAKVGETVFVEGDKPTKRVRVEVKTVNQNGDITADYSYEKDVFFERSEYDRITMNIGYNPIVKKPWNASLRIVAFPLDSILHACGFDRRKRKYNIETVGETIVEELNWDPFIVDKDGNEVSYQRDFVWSLEDKQLLIESIYNNIDIGKIVIRKRSWEWVESRIKSGKKAFFKDVVDGKQRLNAILGFLTDEFPDKQGRYWSEFSDLAQGQFGNFSSISYGELGENATDEDTKSVFLGVNFAGVPMSQEQIDFVKNINL